MALKVKVRSFHADVFFNVFSLPLGSVDEHSLFGNTGAVPNHSVRHSDGAKPLYGVRPRRLYLSAATATHAGCAPETSPCRATARLIVGSTLRAPDRRRRR